MTSVCLAACSSDDNASPPTFAPFDSGTVVVPEAGAPRAPITVQVQGQGTIESSDAHLADGGTVGAVICTAKAAATKCTAPQFTVLYSIPAPGWVLQGWSTTGLPSGTDIGAGMPSFTVSQSTPSPLIATFIPEAVESPSGSGSTPDDGGQTD